MMISPNSFYEDNLKGKTKEEVLSVIKGLKRDITSLNKDLFKPKINIFPNPAVIIDFDKEYLALAIKTYTELGGNYVLTKAEQKEAAFDNKLAQIEKIELSWEGDIYELTQDNLDFEELRELHMGSWKTLYNFDKKPLKWKLVISYKDNSKPFISKGSSFYPCNWESFMMYFNIS